MDKWTQMDAANIHFCFFIWSNNKETILIVVMSTLQLGAAVFTQLPV